MTLFDFRKTATTSLLAAACLLAMPPALLAQHVTAASGSALPDACRLLPESDLTALYPGRPIASKGPSLSPLSRGPQYVESCQYVARLPSGTSQRDIARFVSLSVVRFDGVSERGDAGRSFAHLRELREKLAKDPKIELTVRPLPDIGDEAFAEIRRGNVAVTARRQDLIFVVTVDAHADDTLRNASALARQAAGRWQEGIGMVAYAGPITSNDAVAIPPDTRPPSVAAAADWPDACALLTPVDLSRVFPAATIKAPRPVAGQLTRERRDQRTERLPKPIGCLYEIRRTVSVGGEARTSGHLAQVSVKNVAADLDLSRRFYEVSRKVVGPLTPIEGLGDEAGFDVLNRITIRKGLVTMEIKVTGGERDPAVHTEARERAIDLARIAVQRLP